jgi:hypothetical protein
MNAIKETDLTLAGCSLLQGCHHWGVGVRYDHKYNEYIGRSKTGSVKFDFGRGNPKYFNADVINSYEPLHFSSCVVLVFEKGFKIDSSRVESVLKNAAIMDAEGQIEFIREFISKWEETVYEFN